MIEDVRCGLPMKALFNQSRPTIARRILWQIGAIIAVVIIVVTWLSYRNTVDTLRQEAIENLRGSVQARAEFESVDFEIAQTNTTSLREEYKRRLTALGDSDPVAKFDAWFVLDVDGVVRVRPAFNDRNQWPSVFIHKMAPVTPAMRRQVVAAFELLRDWGPALTQRYFSAYIDVPGQSLVMYSPQAKWGQSADSNPHALDHPPLVNASSDQNTTPVSDWAHVYFDDTVLTWMIASHTPIHQDDWTATVSQDIPIDGLIERTNERAAPGTYNLILNADGRLLAHPQLMVPIRRGGGTLDIATLNDPLLQDILDQARKVGRDSVVEPSRDGRYYLGISRIKGPQWYWVTVYPKSLVEARGIAAARLILFTGLVGLVVELALLAWIIRRSVSAPLKALHDATQSLADGNLEVHLNVAGQEELAQLAQNFQQMTEKLREREDVLVRSEAFKNTLFQTIPDLAFVKNLQGQYVAANRAFSQAYGLAEQDLLGKSDYDLVPAEDANFYARRDAEALMATGPSASEHESVNARTGIRSHYETVKTPIFDSTGTCIGLLGIARNITERKRQESQLHMLNAQLEDRVQQRTQALETINNELREAMQTLKATQSELVQGEKLASLGRLVAGVAHELNTPIGNALTIGSTLGDRVRSMSKAMDENAIKRSELVVFFSDCVSGVEVLERALRQANHLIGSFKQVAADQQSEQRRSFDLATHVDEILAILRPGFRGISLQLEAKVAAGILMDSYPGLLAQVLTNLVTNARVHAFEGLAAGVIQVVAVELGESVELSVIDDGNGIPEQIRSRIFDPFFTTRLGRGGTGLGLSIVHGLVTQGLGGLIRVDHSRLRGTAFVVTLPKCDPRPARHEGLDDGWPPH